MKIYSIYMYNADAHGPCHDNLHFLSLSHDNDDDNEIDDDEDDTGGDDDVDVIELLTAEDEFDLF